MTDNLRQAVEGPRNKYSSQLGCEFCIVEIDEHGKWKHAEHCLWRELDAILAAHPPEPYTKESKMKTATTAPLQVVMEHVVHAINGETHYGIYDCTPGNNYVGAMRLADAEAYVAFRNLSVGDNSQADRPVAECMDCHLPYAEHGCDVTLPNEQWRMIHDSPNGLLCGRCIAVRASKLEGAVAIRAHIEFAGEREKVDADFAEMATDKQYQSEALELAGGAIPSRQSGQSRNREQSTPERPLAECPVAGEGEFQEKLLAIAQKESGGYYRMRIIVDLMLPIIRAYVSQQVAASTERAEAAIRETGQVEALRDEDVILRDQYKEQVMELEQQLTTATERIRELEHASKNE